MVESGWPMRLDDTDKRILELLIANGSGDYGAAGPAEE